MRAVRTLVTMMAVAALGLDPCRAQSISTGSVESGIGLSPVAGSSEMPSSSAAEAQVGAHPELEVWIHPRLAPKLRRKLEAALPVAAQRIRDHAACRGLFEELGANGQRTLRDSMYFATSVRHESKLCSRTSAFTTVGTRPTHLCRSFGRLPASQAAVILIHEALHQAGMSERPLDPRAMASSQINQLVRKSCGL
jgi:hypothetical protein